MPVSPSYSLLNMFLEFFNSKYEVYKRSYLIFIVGLYI